MNNTITYETEIPIISTIVYEIKQLQQQINNHITRLDHQVRYDGLTDLINRRVFDNIINEYISKKLSFSLIMLDIDHFKNINDAYGHTIGDEVLVDLAKEMKANFKKPFICARYGGEEFVLLMPDISEERAYKKAELFRRHIGNRNFPNKIKLQLSLGITSSIGIDADSVHVINRADLALYYSKNNGRNQTTVFDEGIFESSLN